MSKNRLGYGTYGLKTEDVYDAVVRIAKIGYEALELTVADGWLSAPGNLDAVGRKRLRGLIEEVGLTSPTLLMLPHPFAPEAAAAFETQLRDACQLANDLNFETEKSPIVTLTLGSHVPAWDTGRDEIAAKNAWMASIASEYNVTLAVEPHVGSSVDTPEKAVWLIESVGQPNLRLNCDISHFLAQGLDIPHALKVMIPYTVYTHVKDVGALFPPPNFVLPGEGKYDFTPYFTQLQALGYQGPVVVEVSGMIWNRPDYRPWPAAEFCFAVLSKAQKASRQG